MGKATNLLHLALCTMEPCPGSPIISPFPSPHILLASALLCERVNIGCLSPSFVTLSYSFLSLYHTTIHTYEDIAAAAAFQSALAHSVESYVTSFCPPRKLKHQSSRTHTLEPIPSSNTTLLRNSRLTIATPTPRTPPFPPISSHWNSLQPEVDTQWPFPASHSPVATVLSIYRARGKLLGSLSLYPFLCKIISEPPTIITKNNSTTIPPKISQLLPLPP